LQHVADVNLDKQVKNTQGMFAAITAGTVAASVITEVTRALQNHLRESVALADQLDDLGGRAGVAASELQRIGNTAQQNNGSIQGTADALSKLQISAQGALGGNKPLLEMFERLGITTKDLRTLSPDQLFYKIADAVHSSSDRGRTYADVVGLMSRSSKDLFTTLELGSDQIRRTGDAIGVFSDDTIKRLASAKDSLQSFQNQLTIFAGNSIQLFADWQKYGTDTIADAFSEMFGVASHEIAAFNAVQDRAAEAAEKAKKGFQGENEELDALTAKADEAAKTLRSINDAFSFRAIKDFPVSAQIDLLQFKIARLHDTAAKELPGVMFRSAAELNAAASRLTDPAAQLRVKQLAQNYAALEDQVRSLGDAQKKAAADGKKEAEAQVVAQGDLVKQLRALTLESAKPNLSVADRLKLLEQELAILQKIRESEQARVKAANAANPEAAGRLKDLNDQLANLPVSGRPQDADTRGELQRQRNDLIRSTGVGIEGATTQIDATIKQTNAAIDKLKGSIDSEGGKIPPGLEGVQTALDTALKSFQEGLTKTSAAVDKAAPPVVEAVQSLETSISTGLDGVAGSVRNAAASADRKFDAVQKQIDALWRAV
ncbi:MAG: hypothetical protein LC642_05370, partial [Verrucomicrobiaceae bacterium]|nr:hypothetical protein [Verrucomicrobiaceae bacterium]